MDTILMLISVLCLGKSIMMNSLLPHIRYRLLFGLLCVCSVWLTYPYAIETNKINMENTLLQQDNMTDMTLFFVVDLLMSVAFCWVVFAKWSRKSLQKRAMIWHYIPLLTVFPVIFYLQINLSFLFVGMSFLWLTAVYAAFVFLLVFAGACLIGKFLPETELRLELILIFAGLLFVLMICCTVFHPSAQIFSQSSAVNLNELLFSLALLASIFIIGAFAPKLYKHLKK